MTRAEFRSRSGPQNSPCGGPQVRSDTVLLANYVNNLRHLGFSDADVADGGSDQLIDALVAWGDFDAIVARVQAHLDAGAALQPIGVPRSPDQPCGPSSGVANAQSLLNR